ncbi:MAG: hypothetical protein GC160_30185 [Acidobacteria bacterium]|nr:hypothetical protein [Acidobacteriota bacterium]
MSAFFLQHPKETDLALFAGGEAGPFSRWRIERHIESCSSCRQAVSEYFHLSEELQPLAELPDLNWNAMAAGIERRLAAEGREPAPSRRVPAMAWSLALAAVICGVIVVRQSPWASTAAPEADLAMMRDEVAAGSSAGSAQPFSEERSAAVSQQELAPTAPADAPATAAALESAPLLLGSAQSEPQSPPSSKAKQERAFDSALADRDRTAPADVLAPAPPPAPTVMTFSAAPTLEPRARRETLSVFGGAAPGTAAPVGAAIASGGQRQAARAAASPSPAGLDIQPLFEGAAQVRVAADGWVSVRSVSAEGRVTITDVYAP